MTERYRNEIIILISFILLIFSVIYKHHSISKLENAINETRSSISDIDESKRLKSLWYARGMKSKLNILKKKVSAKKIVKFSIERKKVNIKLRDLRSSELNIFMNELAKLPVRISALNISRTQKGYGLECLCKW